MAMSDMSVRPRDRVLNTAADLFYEDGIRAVGVDRVVAESGVSKMTLYRHFPSKDELILATLRERDEPLRAVLESLARQAGSSPRDQLIGLFKKLELWFALPNFRGCRFTNATIEIANESAAIREMAQLHKAQIAAFLERLAREAGLTRPAELARELMIVYDGAIITAVLQGDPHVGRTAAKAARLLIEAHTPGS
jgi:AcrR family transcriptional regulator